MKWILVPIVLMLAAGAAAQGVFLERGGQGGRLVAGRVLADGPDGWTATGGMSLDGPADLDFSLLATDRSGLFPDYLGVGFAASLDALDLSPRTT